jgi:hypothetical protein
LLFLLTFSESDYRGGSKLDKERIEKKSKAQPPTSFAFSSSSSTPLSTARVSAPLSEEDDFVNMLKQEALAAISDEEKKEKQSEEGSMDDDVDGKKEKREEADEEDEDGVDLWASLGRDITVPTLNIKKLNKEKQKDKFAFFLSFLVLVCFILCPLSLLFPCLSFPFINLQTQDSRSALVRFAGSRIDARAQARSQDDFFACVYRSQTFLQKRSERQQIPQIFSGSLFVLLSPPFLVSFPQPVLFPLDFVLDIDWYCCGRLSRVLLRSSYQQAAPPTSGAADSRGHGASVLSQTEVQRDSKFQSACDQTRSSVCIVFLRILPLYLLMCFPFCFSKLGKFNNKRKKQRVL